MFRTSRTESDFATATTEPPDLDIYQGYDDFAAKTSRKKKKRKKKAKEINEAQLISSSVPWSRLAISYRLPLPFLKLQTNLAV